MGGGGGQVIDAVLHGVGGGGFALFADAPLFAQPAPVEHVARQQRRNTDDQKYQTIHRCVLPSFLIALDFGLPKLFANVWRASRPAGLDRKLFVDPSIAAMRYSIQPWSIHR